MRKLLLVAVSLLILAHQAIIPVPSAIADVARAQVAEAAPSPKYKVNIDLSKPQPVQVATISAGFDAEVLAPLRARQEADAEAQKARLALLRRVVTIPLSAARSTLSDTAIQQLGFCESGLTANRNSGNGFYGAFQFSIGTWNSMGTGYARADLAPLDVQIDAVRRLLGRSSIYGQFPACSHKLAASGLI